MNKLIVIDGNSLINRAFFALPNLSASGVSTGGLFGLGTMIFGLLDAQKPTHFVVAFDMKAPTFRHAQYSEYKGTRKGMPDELAQQMPLAKQFLDLLGVARVELEGYEADDLIGTIARQTVSKGWQTLIYTGDKDALQLVDLGADVFVTKKGVSEVVHYTPARIEEELSVTPAQIVDLKGLSGDTSDNIPGIPGVGPKTAAKLLAQFGTVEEVVARSAEIDNKRLRGLVDEHADMALLSKRLATICVDAPIEFGDDALLLRAPDEAGLVEFLSRYQLKSLLERFRRKTGGDAGAASPKAGADTPHRDHDSAAGDSPDRQTVPVDIPAWSASGDPLSVWIAQIDPAEPVEIVSLCDIEDNRRVPRTLLLGQRGSYACVDSPDDLFSGEQGTALRLMLEQETIRKCGYDIKDFVIWCIERGISIAGVTGDVMIAAYLLDPARRSYELADLAYEELLYAIPSVDDVLGKGVKRVQYRALSADDCVRFAAQRLAAAHALNRRYVEKLENLSLTSLYLDVEMPLLRVLAEMEVTGFRLDAEALAAIDEALKERIRTLEERIYRIAGESFNIQSPRQLGVILFEKLGLPAPKKTKTGYSTNHEVLVYLSSKHEIAQDIIDYRMVTKLKSTYVDGLAAVTYGGRVHTSLNQTIAVTGRLSSTEPNLQNIPIRLAEGRELRKAFVADEGCVLIDADYSQIELRVLAHLSGDQRLVEAYREGEDIHRITASQVFGTPIDQVTPQQRTRAKEVNFGIVYGMGDFGLSDRLGIPIAEAGRYIEGYFRTYPGVQRFMHDVIASCKKDGYVTTILGRRRIVSDINNRNFHLRTAAERTARNTPIQGSAADIIKLAMIRVADALKSEGLRTKLILQVHDELILNAPIDEVERASALLKECMENAYPMSVPLDVEVNIGRSWYEAH